MRRVSRSDLTLTILVVLLAGLVWSCLPADPLVITLSAQTLPVTKTLAWDDPTAGADGVTNYVVTLDGTAIGSPTGLTQPVTFTTIGMHTLTVVAVNVWGTSGPATLVVNVVVPAVPTTLHLQ